MEKREIRVLVVEDSPTDIELLRQSMKDFKFLKCRLTEVRTAAGAEAAMANTRFEAVLLDLNLPDSRGLESLARVKASGKATAVIIMTVSGEQETILKALSMGAQNFIVKGDETAVSLERAIMFSVEREKSVEALREAEEKYRLLYTSMGQGLAVHDAVFNADGKMTDYVFREVNESFERLTGLKAKEIVGKRVRQAVPGVEEKWIEAYDRVVRTGVPELLEDYSEPLGRYFSVYAYRPRPGQFAAIVNDITERKLAEKEEKFFSGTVAAVLAAESLDEVCDALTSNISAYTGGFITVMSMLDPDGTSLSVRSYSGLNVAVENIVKTLGVDPRKKKYYLSDMKENELKAFRSGTVMELEDGLFSLMTGKVPKPVCRSAETLMGVKRVYTIGFTSGGMHIGGISILASSEMTGFKKGVERVVNYIASVVARKRAEEALRNSEDKWRAFIDATDDNLMLWDGDLNLVAANKMAKEVYAKMTGRELKIGCSMLELMSGLKNTERYEKYKEVVRTGTPYFLDEYSMRGEGGEERYFSLKAFRVGNGLGLITSDITDLKRSEIILKQSYEKLREADKLKSNFISIVSHELRTPLTIIKGFTSFLEKEAAGGLNETQKNFVSTISSNTERLARIINDMVDMSKIESGIFSIEKERRELVSLINEVVESMRHVAGEKGVFLSAEFSGKNAIAYVDKGRIVQTVSNLINNAVRFSGNGGNVIVSLAAAEKAVLPARIAEKMSEEKNYYHICVRDEGAGIEEKYLDKIFERFFQVESANTRKHQGAGLGLSIAKSIVEAHGGQIWAESDGPGKGAKIQMIIPEA